MAGLLYYIPGHSGQMTAGDACKRGLAHAFAHLLGSEDVGLTCCGVQNNGPDAKDGGGGGAGGAGTVVVDPAFVGKVGVYENQRWRKVPGSKAYVGCFTDDPPKPEDLARAPMLPGHLVTLGDEQRWLIPIARGMLEHEDELLYHCPLPTATTIDENDEWQRGEVMLKYAPLWETAKRVWDAISGALLASAKKGKAKQKLSIDFAGENDAALLALATNYRVGKAEVVLLGLFNDQAAGEILAALVEWHTVTAWLEKKTAAGGSSTGDGQAADTPDTDQR